MKNEQYPRTQTLCSRFRYQLLPPEVFSLFLRYGTPENLRQTALYAGIQSLEMTHSGIVETVLGNMQVYVEERVKTIRGIDLVIPDNRRYVIGYLQSDKGRYVVEYLSEIREPSQSDVSELRIAVWELTGNQRITERVLETTPKSRITQIGFTHHYKGKFEYINGSNMKTCGASINRHFTRAPLPPYTFRKNQSCYVLYSADDPILKVVLIDQDVFKQSIQDQNSVAQVTYEGRFTVDDPMSFFFTPANTENLVNIEKGILTIHGVHGQQWKSQLTPVEFVQPPILSVPFNPADWDSITHGIRLTAEAFVANSHLIQVDGENVTVGNFV